MLIDYLVVLVIKCNQGLRGTTMIKPIVLVCSLLPCVLSSCANVSAIPVEPGSKVQGIRIYDVKPLLVVTGTSVTLLMVPNYNRAYAVQFSTFLAKHDFEADFSNGFMTKIHSNQDTTAVATALINVVQEAIKTGNPIGDAFSGKTAGGAEERFGVYDIVFDNHGNLIGLRPLLDKATLIKVPASSVRAVPGFQSGQPGADNQPRVNAN